MPAGCPRVAQIAHRKRNPTQQFVGSPELLDGLRGLPFRQVSAAQKVVCQSVVRFNLPGPLMRATTNPHGDTFTGTFVSGSFDTFGNIIPELHAEGTVNSTRITVD